MATNSTEIVGDMLFHMIQNVTTYKANLIGYDKAGKEYRGVQFLTKFMKQKRMDIFIRLVELLAAHNSVSVDIFVDFKFEPLED